MHGRRSFSCLSLGALLVLALGAGAAASFHADVQVYVDGRPVVAEVPARIAGGRTFLPLRAVAEALGLEVAWQEEARTVLLVNPRAPGQWPGPDLPLLPVAAVAPPVRWPPAPDLLDRVARVQVAVEPGVGLAGVRMGAAAPEPVWRLALPGMHPGPVALDDGATYFAYTDRRGAHVLKVDNFTGDRLWARDLPEPAAALAPWGGVLFLAHGRAVEARDATLGDPVYAWGRDATAGWGRARPPGLVAGRDLARSPEVAAGRDLAWSPEVVPSQDQPRPVGAGDSLAAAGAGPDAGGPAGRPDAAAAPPAERTAALMLAAGVKMLVVGGEELVAVRVDGVIHRWAPRRPQGDVLLRLNGRLLYPDAPPFIADGRTLVPVRVISEGLGARVEWDAATRTVTITRP